MATKITRKRKLSPSGSKARIDEHQNGPVYGEITDPQGYHTKLSLGAMRLLQGLLLVAIEPVEKTMVKRPVKRRLDFDNLFDIVVEDDEAIPCGQKSPLVELEVALRGGYLRDGWMTSRVNDIMWLLAGWLVVLDLTAV